jgi:hypothetical protein
MLAGEHAQGHLQNFDHENQWEVMQIRECRFHLKQKF